MAFQTVVKDMLPSRIRVPFILNFDDVSPIPFENLPTTTIPYVFPYDGYAFFSLILNRVLPVHDDTGITFFLGVGGGNKINFVTANGGNNRVYFTTPLLPKGTGLFAAGSGYAPTSTGTFFRIGE